MKFILIGIARSGTTIICKFLNSLPNTICLSEPHIEHKRKGKIKFLAQDPRIREKKLPFISESTTPMDAAVTRMLHVADRVGFKETLIPKSIYPGVDYHTDQMILNYMASGYRLLALVRDPVGNYNSLKRMKWGNLSRLDKMVENYQFLDNMFLDVAHGIIVYERFIADPAKEMSGIPGFENTPALDQLKHLPMVQGDLTAASSAQVEKERKTPNEVTEEELDVLAKSEAYHVYTKAVAWRKKA